MRRQSSFRVAREKRSTIVNLSIHQLRKRRLTVTILWWKTFLLKIVHSYIRYSSYTIDTETQLTLLAGKILTPLSELIVHQPKKDECKDLLYQIRQDDINQRKVEEERKERIKQKEIQARKFELERQDRLKLEEFELDKRFKLEERMANIQARNKEREERIIQDERLNNFRSFRLKLLFFAFLAICSSVSYILPALKEVLIEYFRGLYHKRN